MESNIECRLVDVGVQINTFCSKRCTDIDLGRWFRGDYAVPAVENDDAPEEVGEGEE